MGMVVRSNIMALNANRQLGMNNSQVSKSLEKLSSGFKINRAGDDASGLAISEKMKAQIKALDTASSNCQDGISLVQTAEGALTEVHDMLNRMVELAGKSANGTMERPTDANGTIQPETVNKGGTDRNALQEEMNALCKEIDRIADSTNFNGIKLLNGNLSGGSAGNTGSTGNTGSAGNTGNTGNTGGTGDTLTASDITGPTNMAINVSMAAGQQTAKFDLAGVKFAKDGTVSVTFGKRTYDVDVKKDMTDAEFLNALATVYNKNPIIDSAAGEFVASGTAGKPAELQLTGLNSAAASFTWESVVTIVPKAAPTGGTGGTTGSGGTTGGTGGTNGTGGAAKAPTFEPDPAGLAKFNIALVELSGFQGEIDADTKVKMAYDGATQKLSVTIGSDTFESAVLTDNAANLGGQDITLTNGNGETITVKTADTVSEIGKDKTGNIASTVIGTLKPAADNTNGGAGNALILQIGEDGQQWNKMDVAIEDMHIVSLFAQAKAGVVVQNTNETDPAIMTIDISSQDAASNALDSIREAVNTVSTQRSKLGAIQNRLEHTINNLDVASENMNSANSRVRDTDMAKQMMSYTQMNVLTQAAQAMLAQANQQPQSVLQLLQ